MSAVLDKTKEAEIANAKEKAESIKNEFLSEAEKFLPHWYQKTYEYFVNSYPESTQALSAEELDSLRLDVKKLKADMTGKLSAAFDKKENWWHQSDNPSEFDREFYKSINNLMSDEIKYIFGELGDLFYEYGYIWRNIDKGSRGFLTFREGSNRYQYQYIYPIYWSDMMKRRMDNYWEIHKYYLSLTK